MFPRPSAIILPSREPKSRVWAVLTARDKKVRAVLGPPPEEPAQVRRPFLRAPISRLAVRRAPLKPSRTRGKSSRMNTYAKSKTNPFRMRTYKMTRRKSPGMNTYKKVGEGVPDYCYAASCPESGIGSEWHGDLPARRVRAVLTARGRERPSLAPRRICALTSRHAGAKQRRRGFARRRQFSRRARA